MPHLSSTGPRACWPGFLLSAALMVLVVPVCTAGTLVRVDTSLGGFSVELLDDIAPGTVANFLNYVNSGRYDGTFVHRLEPGFVIQGGWLTFIEEESLFRPLVTDDPITNEFSVSNTRGTLAMAKVAGNPDSATSQWFVNLADNGLLDTDNGGFTVFAEVLGNGMEVVDAIAGLPQRALSQATPVVPVIDYEGGSLSNANLVTVQMKVLPNVYAQEEGLLTLQINAPGIGLLKVEFSVVSVDEGIIQADGNSAEDLVEELPDMATFDTTTNRLQIPELVVNGEVVFRNVVFVLTDGEQLLFQVESFDQI